MATVLNRFRGKSKMGEAYSGDESLNLDNMVKIIDNYVYINGINTGVYVRGSDGKSAYEIAVEHGFVGTEEEWLDSLRATVTVNSTETGDAGTAAEVEDVDADPQKTDLRFRIPKGQDGKETTWEEF